MRRTASILPFPSSRRLDQLAALCGDRVADACRRLVGGATAAPHAPAPHAAPGGRAVHVTLPAGARLPLAGLIGAAPQAGVLDAVRRPLEGALGRDVQLRLLRLVAADGWAFVVAEPLDADASPLDLTGAAGGAPRLCALARAEADGSWRTVAYAFDGRRETWERWPARFGVAADVFPRRVWGAAA
jgi:hypothetical protein